MANENGGHIDPVICPICRKGFYYCFPGIKPQPAEKGMLCEDCTKERLRHLTSVPIWYCERRDEHFVTFALRRTWFKRKAKKATEDFAGEWTYRKLSREAATLMLKKYYIGNIYVEKRIGR